MKTNMSKLEKGDICRTNVSQPGGLVMVLEVALADLTPPRQYCRIVHLEDHPYGYEAGTLGGYYADELIKVNARIAIDTNAAPKQMKGYYMFPPSSSLRISATPSPNGFNWRMSVYDEDLQKEIAFGVGMTSPTEAMSDGENFLIERRMEIGDWHEIPDLSQ